MVTLERVPSATACSGSGRLGIARLPSRAVVRLRKRHIALVPRLPLIPSALGATPPAEPLTAAAVAAAAEALGLAVGAMAWAPPVRAHAPMATRAAMVPPPLRVVLARADATSAAQGRDMALALDRAFARARLLFFCLYFACRGDGDGVGGFYGKVLPASLPPAVPRSASVPGAVPVPGGGAAATCPQGRSVASPL